MGNYKDTPEYKKFIDQANGKEQSKHVEKINVSHMLDAINQEFINSINNRVVSRNSHKETIITIKSNSTYVERWVRNFKIRAEASRADGVDIFFDQYERVYKIILDAETYELQDVKNLENDLRCERIDYSIESAIYEKGADGRFRYPPMINITKRL